MTVPDIPSVCSSDNVGQLRLASLQTIRHLKLTCLIQNTFITDSQMWFLHSNYIVAEKCKKYSFHHPYGEGRAKLVQKAENGTAVQLLPYYQDFA